MRYHRLGNLPAQRHIQFPNPKGGLYTEQLISTHGFSGPCSMTYHINLPTRVSGWRDLGPCQVTLLKDESVHHRHLKTKNMVPKGDAISGRIPLMGNAECTWNQVYVAEPMQHYFKNADCDEILFVHDGEGTLHTMYGDIPFFPGDYLVIPRATIWKIEFKSHPVRMLAIESVGEVTIPKRYMNNYGQMQEHAPYSERDFRPPSELVTIDEKGDFKVVVKTRGRYTEYSYDYHPFDIVGWDGYCFPYAFSIHAFSPIVGKLHMPPPIHQTFNAAGFVICSFCPRVLDFHPQAVVVPYVHSNVDSDEVLYYCNDKFGSRKGIEEGSITVHPLGIPHGPQPGVVEASIGATKTEELAVMLDTYHALYLTREALELEDPDYWKSWAPK